MISLLLRKCFLNNPILPRSSDLKLCSAFGAVQSEIGGGACIRRRRYAVPSAARLLCTLPGKAPFPPTDQPFTPANPLAVPIKSHANPPEASPLRNLQTLLGFRVKAPGYPSIRLQTFYHMGFELCVRDHQKDSADLIPFHIIQGPPSDCHVF